jgi:hypothetical protein
LAAARAKIAALRAEVAAAREGACLRLLLALLFYGLSLRATAACLNLACGDAAPGKSTIAARLDTYCTAAERLFRRHFEGRGLAGACDEVYLSGHALLEVVEPLSLALVGLQPDTPPTEEAWTELLGRFATLESAVSDQGLSVAAAVAKKVLRHALDIWHLLRKFAAAAGRLETQAYERLADAEEKMTAFLAALPAPTGTRVPPELEKLERAQQKCAQAIHRYDDASTILGWLYEAARPVDMQGRVRTPQQIRDDWEAALDLVDYLDAQELYALEPKLRGKVDGACVSGLEERLRALPLPSGWHPLEREELQRLACQAWRYHHRQQTHILAAPQQAAQTVAAHLGLSLAAPHLVPYCTAVFAMLDRTLVASAAVECVNSIIRLRQGNKRHPSPNFVYLLAWLHNTRPFTEGRRKGLTPAEILGVKLPADGWTMLQQEVARTAA